MNSSIRENCIPQDKARLAADVMQYSNQVATDWEAKEALGVESDVWRSKYLASSVIVEELDKSRQVGHVDLSMFEIWVCPS